jgi:hypothetical protein
MRTIIEFSNGVTKERWEGKKRKKTIRSSKSVQGDRVSQEFRKKMNHSLFDFYALSLSVSLVLLSGLFPSSRVIDFKGIINRASTNLSCYQALAVVSPKSVSSSWMTRPVLSSVTSRDLVRSIPDSFYEDKTNGLTISTVREDDILCLLESEREARRLR